MTSAVRTVASFVKFEHSVFALPFAYAGLALGLAATGRGLDWLAVLWVTVAMVGARTVAMALNRILDASLDARNPRTAARELPSGRMTEREAWTIVAVALGALLVAVWQLDPIVRLLWPIPVALFVVYPLSKRVTWLCHALLGVTIGLAAPAAWLAVGASAADPTPWLLGLGIALWIGGFDVIYATLDVEVDRREGLHSIPACFGVRRALHMVRGAHLAAVAAFVALGVVAGLGAGFWVALGVAAVLLAWESAIVRADDLSRVDVAFFTVNSWVGVVLGAGIVAGLVT